VTKARACKVTGQKGSLGVKESVREWTLTLPKELPLCELESQWTLECSESDYKGQNPMARGFFYTIGKLLKCRCLKWARMTHLDNLKHKLWPKEALGVKLAVWLLTTKSQESLRLPCVKVTCNIPLESSQRVLKLCFRPYLNQRSTHKVMGPQSHKSPNFGNFGGLPLGSPSTKSHLDVGLVERHKVYYKGEGGGSPGHGSLVSLSCPWLILAPKVLQLCNNHLVLVFCRSMWVVDACLSS